MLSSAQARDQVVRALREGEAVVLPTDTLFGLGVCVSCCPDPKELYRIKRRDEGKPIAWLVASPSALDLYGEEVPEEAHLLADAFWPGPLTLIVRASSLVPPAYRSKQGTIGLRMPASEAALSLIAQAGGPLATTSANLSGNSDALTFSALDERVLSQVGGAFDDGEEKSGIASTVVDVSQGDLVVKREGAISPSQLRCALARGGKGGDHHGS